MRDCSAEGIRGARSGGVAWSGVEPLIPIVDARHVGRGHTVSTGWWLGVDPSVRRSSIYFVAGFAVVSASFLLWWPLGVAVGLLGSIAATLRIERWIRATSVQPAPSAPIEPSGARDLLDHLGFAAE